MLFSKQYVFPITLFLTVTGCLFGFQNCAPKPQAQVTTAIISNGDPASAPQIVQSPGYDE